MAKKSGTALFVCDCGGTMKKSVDVNKLQKSFKGKDGLAEVFTHSALCKPEGVRFIVESVKESGAERVLIAACSPVMFEDTFKQAAVDAGINSALMARANIREQCAWIVKDKAEATGKAAEIIEGALKRCSLLEPFDPLREKLSKNVLVIGGGVAGLTAAKLLGESGIKVTLIEKESKLGGNVARLSFLYQGNGSDPARIVDGLVEEVKNDNNIEIILEAHLESLEGQVGNFRVAVDGKQGRKTKKVGAVIVAVGYEADYPFDKLDIDRTSATLTVMELERLLAKEKLTRNKC
ncbi:unnamed protein product, partial [marine sediment metagenome]